jgi:signal transduction histidine kinase
MTSMVNDLLEYARTQLDGSIPIVHSQVNVEEICRSALEDAKATHPNCPFELKTAGHVFGSFDTHRLQQVFANLLNNAAQYRAGERPVTLQIEGKSDAIAVHIHNFGHPIPPESIKIIFDPLIQLELTEKQSGRPATSLGLGLFIARQITEAHGGTISVESNEVSGTTFSVLLPREHRSKNAN